MIGEFLGGLFEFGIIMLLILSFLSGATVGWAYLNWVGNVVWFVILAFLQMLILNNTEYIGILAEIIQIGMPGANVANSVLLMHEFVHPALLVLWIIFGRASKRSDQETRNAAAKALAPEFYKTDLDVLGASPELAVAGWFEARWNRMDGAQRLQWAMANISDLRRIWADGDDNGFEKYGTNLPSLLAKVDIATIPPTAQPIQQIESVANASELDDDVLTPEFFRLQLKLISGDPQFAKIGWFKERWEIMDENERLLWVEQNLDSFGSKAMMSGWCDMDSACRTHWQC